MRREIVLREINQGALAGMSSKITTYAADLVVDALDRYDAWVAIQREEQVRAWADEANETGGRPTVIAVDGRSGEELFRGGYEGYLDQPSVLIRVGPRVFANWPVSLCRPPNKPEDRQQKEK